MSNKTSGQNLEAEKNRNDNLDKLIRFTSELRQLLRELRKTLPILQELCNF